MDESSIARCFRRRRLCSHSRPLSFRPGSPGSRQGCTATPAKTAHRTPDGQPDLQGVWSSASVIPLERPKDLGAKEFFTKEEAEAYEKKMLAVHEVSTPGTYGDVHYSMAQFGLEKGQAQVASTIRTSIIVGPDRASPSMLPEARKGTRRARRPTKGHEFDGPENRRLAEQCILWANEGPPIQPAGYNSNLQIVQGPGYVAILQEMIHDVRIIPTDGSPHLPANIRQWFGDSRGHWEGETLVVDTTNFTNRTAFRGSSENLHVVERFTRRRTIASSTNSPWKIRPPGPNRGAANSHDQDRRTNLRIRLPRRQLRNAEQPERRARRGESPGRPGNNPC